MMVRSLRPADVLPLLFFLSNSPANEAKVRGRLCDAGSKAGPILPLLVGCFVSQRRQRSIVQADGGAVRGLVCLRSCRAPIAWEIERLLLAHGHEGCCVSLLEMPGSAGDALKAGWIYLRLDSTSQALAMARQAGFSQYLTEHLYRLDEGPRPEPKASGLVARPKQDADERAIFRLYSAAVPLPVRRVEGMTFEEWLGKRECGAFRELVVEDKGESVGWLRLRLDRSAGEFHLMTAREGASLDEMVDVSLTLLGGRKATYCLVAEFQSQLRRALEERGFRQVVEYSCLSRQLVVPVREPQLVPLGA